MESLTEVAAQMGMPESALRDAIAARDARRKTTQPSTSQTLIQLVRTSSRSSGGSFKPSSRRVSLLLPSTS